MKPITFSCEATLPQAPEEIASQILDLSRWPEFHGYGPLPGIKHAEFDTKTADVVGTRIRVTNRDGSTHVEEIVEWEPIGRLRLHMHEFSPPVSRLAKGFDETWEFRITGNGTKVVRSFELHPKSMLARPLLWLISLILKRAIARHFTSMQQQVENRS
ncbi:MAG: SRPBCC family protein [Planctomycetaceae bacterium]